MIQLVAFDLDETLLCDDKSISKGNLEALLKAKEKGIKLVPCSGRGPRMLQDLYDTLQIYEKDQYSILCNGGIIVDNFTNEVLISHPLKKELIQPLFEYGMKKDINVQIFTKDHLYTYNTDQEEKEIIEKVSKGQDDYIIYKEGLDLSYLENIDVIKMLFQRKDMDFLKKVKEDLDYTKDDISISFSSGRYLELNTINVHKGLGIQELSKYLHIDIQDTLGIGDNYNDYEMIRDAGIGCAVQNAIDECKQVANYICPKTNNEDAIEEILNKYVL